MAEPHVLTDLEIDTAEMFSVVKQGAGGTKTLRPKIVLFKRKGGAMTLFEKLKKLFAKADGAAMKTPEEILQGALDGLPEEKQDLIMAAMAAIHASGALPKAAPPPPADEPKEPEAKAEGEEQPKEPPMDEELKKAFAKAAPEMQAAFAAVLKMAKDAVDAQKQSDAKLAEVQKQLDAEKAERKGAAALERAKALKGVPGKAEEIAKLLVAAESMPDEVKKTLDGILNQTSALVLKGGPAVFQELGHARGGEDDESAGDKLDRMVREAVEKSDSKKTYEQAYAEIAKKHPQLYRQASDEQMAANARRAH